jgi:hypothetical protein
LLDPEHYRNAKEKENGNARKYKKAFYGHTDYFLAGAILIGSARKLNCYWGIVNFDFNVCNNWRTVVE